MLINAFPNRRVLCYGYREQAADLAPVWGLALVCGGICYGLQSWLTLAPWLMILLVAGLFVVLFLAGGWYFRCEALMYVLQQGRRLYPQRFSGK